jgi:hypothetical protein
MKLTTRITALLITSWMLWHLTATHALAATINIAQGDNAATKFQQVQSGDSVVIGDGVFNVNVTLQGKSNVTITAANVGTVTVSRKPDNTPWAVGTRVTLDGGGTRWGFRAVDCPNLTIKGITLNNGGLRLENCGNAKIQDFISQNGNYGGIETDTPGNPNGNGRASGLNLLRVACQGNGAVGMNLSSYRQVRGSYLYLFSNNPGLPAKPVGWPSGSVLRNGKWFAQVQDSGGGGKWCLLDDVVIDHLWTENNTGIGWWLDVYNQAVTIRHSQFLNQKWVEFNYDAFGSQTEICYGPTRYEDCYFSGDNAWLNIAESNQTTVTGCVFVRERDRQSLPRLMARSRGVRGNVVTGNFSTTARDIPCPEWRCRYRLERHRQQPGRNRLAHLEVRRHRNPATP